MARSIKFFARTIYFAAVSALAWLLGRLPDRMLLAVKAKSGIVKKMDYGRHDIFLHVDSDIENTVRLYSCGKDSETVDWIEGFFREGDLFFDIGANVGAYCLVAAKFGRGNIKVYSFEPSFVTFPRLCKNIIANNCQESIVPLQVALPDKTSMALFNYNNLIPGGAIHALGEAIDQKGNSFEPVAKQTVIS